MPSSSELMGGGSRAQESGRLADKNEMTTTIGVKEVLQDAQALLQYAAHRLAVATHDGAGATVYDTVSLSDTALAVIEGKISGAAKAIH
jgi:hypothetical protein